MWKGEDGLFKGVGLNCISRHIDFGFGENICMALEPYDYPSIHSSRMIYTCDSFTAISTP
jgi:hypothetical protein